MSEADWLIEEDFEKTGTYHMERDEALARERVANPALPSVLRLYSWRPPAISIGYQQDMNSIDRMACEAHGIDIVRRPTGGRAVLHMNELTYAVITRVKPTEGIYAVHNKIIVTLLKSLAFLQSQLPIGGPLTVTPRSGTTWQKNSLPVACFASAARHEVTWQGKKVIGSAQRRFGEVVLQHGSILLTEDHLLLPELLALGENAKQQMLMALKSATATLADVFGRTISITESAEAVRRNFVTNFLIHSELIAAD